MSEQETEGNTTMPDASNPPAKISLGTDSESKQSGDDDTSANNDTSTITTEANDSDSTIGSSDTKKDGSSDAETDAETETDAESAKEDTRTQEEKDKEAKEKEEAEKKEIEELKIKYKDWPLKDIKEPHLNDVMYGRGGGTNHHLGNKRYRKMVESRKLKYVNSKRLDKPLVALEIIREWRAQLPSGRFLKYNDKGGTWEDVGDKKAREKTSQALREKAPQIRKQQQEDEMEGDEVGDKTTRFAEGTKGNKKGSKLKKAILARDHSLGREYLGSDEKVDLQGFTWQDPFKKGARKETSIGSSGSSNGPGLVPGAVLPSGRAGSMGSIGSIGSHFSQFGRGGQPPPSTVPDYYGRLPYGEPRREFSNGSLGSLNPPYLPPPTGAHHQRSGSWTHPPPPPPYPHRQRSGSWGGGGREHSFSMNPLAFTSINRPAPVEAFDPSVNRGAWNGHHNFPPPPDAHQQGPPSYAAPPAPQAYGGVPFRTGGSSDGSSVGSPQGQYRQTVANTPSPPYDALGVAKTWTGGGAPQAPGTYGNSQYGGHPQSVPGADTSPQRGSAEPHHVYGSMPRPAMVKRDTSNQNESYETKPSRIKKAALNRDQSATSNRLKQQYVPELFNKDMQSLHEKTGNIRLSSPVPDRSHALPKPPAVDFGGRQTTEEALTRYFLDEPPPQPAPLKKGDRQNTMDELGYDLLGESDSLTLESTATDYEKLPPMTRSLAKPRKLTPNDRLTTTEFMTIVNAPFAKCDGDENPLPL